MSQESALAGICIAADHIPTKPLSKLDSVKPASVEAYYMLATYVFDLQRKFEYIFKATKEFAPWADSALAQEIQNDTAALDELGQNWERAARKAEEIMLRLYREIGAEHERLLKQAAAKGGRK